MTWCAVLVRVDSPLREAVGQWLVETTGQAIEERPDGTLVGFLEDAEEYPLLEQDLGRRFGSGIPITSQPLDPVDWSERWREGLGPRQFGRLTVIPSWLPVPPTGGPITVVLDPETAFGSGEHGSTRGVLALLERRLRPGDRVLDLGSGSGILSIAAAKLGARAATGVELDEEAIPVARRNAERNGVTDVVNFLDGDAAMLLPLLAPAEMILSNILRHVNLGLLEGIRGALTRDGVAIYSGMEVTEAALFRPALEQTRYRVVDEVVDEGWWTVAAVPA